MTTPQQSQGVSKKKVFGAILLCLMVVLFVLSRNTHLIPVRVQGLTKQLTGHLSNQISRGLSGRSRLVTLVTVNTTWKPNPFILANPGVKLRELWAADIDVFKKLEAYNISSVILSQELNPQKEHWYIAPAFHRWATDKMICGIINKEWKSGRRLNFRYHNFLFGDCTTDQSKTFELITQLPVKYERMMDQTGLELAHIDKLMPTVNTHYPEVTTFLSAVEWVYIVPSAASVYSSSLRFAQLACRNKPGMSPMPTVHPSTKRNNRVFILSQHFVAATYHVLAEQLTRAGPYIQMLRDNPDVSIHVGNHSITRGVLELLGIQTSRLITGHYKADVALIPEGTGCGQNRPMQTQLLYQEVQQALRRKHGQLARDTIVLIKRSKGRRFTQHEVIKSKLQTISREFGLKFYEFDDKKLPPAQEGFKQFYRAIQVVGPHGAGLVNMFFTQPSSFVLEGTCGDCCLNMCYQRLAMTIGLRYYAAGSNGCPNVVGTDPAQIDRVVRANLNEWRKQGDKIFPEWKPRDTSIKWRLKRIANQTQINRFIGPEQTWFDYLQRRQL